MPSSPTHAVAALALAPALLPAGASRRILVLGALCAAAPDLDVAGFAFGVPYAAPFGHRGVTHSLLFAAALALAVTAVAAPRPRARAALYLVVATASHGLLDMLTDGGLGIALCWPFDGARLFFPWRPIAVSPLSPGAFASARGLEVLASEALWVWLPAALFALAAVALRRTRMRPES